jgi:lycopene cyclase domain-containing protein
MTYFRFHLFFNIPIIAILLAWPAGHAWGASEWVAVISVLLAVYGFMTVWDNYAVKEKLWNFPEGKHWQRLWRVPVEEHLFTGLQALEVLLLVNGLIGLGWGAGPSGTIGLRWGSDSSATSSLHSNVVWSGLAALAVVWIFLRLAGARRPLRFNYAWHLFYWFLPILAAEWIIGWGVLAPRWPLLLVPTLAIGLWLTLADLAAVRSGLWNFDPKQVTGLRLFGILPWEEAAFFLLTSLLVAQSYLLLLPEAAR